MKKVLFTLMSIVSMSILSQAQAPWQAEWITDTVGLGASVTQDVFYSFSNGTVRAENNKNWHIAFALSTAGDSAGVWANHQAGNNFTKVFNIHKAASQFSSIVLGDTGATANILYNNDKGWYNGAFNNIASSNVFSFGWGTYDQTVHNVYGDSAFIVRAQGVYYKFVIDSLDGLNAKYYFRVENLTTPAAATSHVVSKSPNFTNRLFAYFNLASLSDTNREPAISAWDVQFCRYTTDAVGSGQGTNNNVIGVLNNKGVRSAKAIGLPVDTAYDLRNNYALDSIISTIGYNWKIFDLNNNIWYCPDSISYFIADKNSNLWQLQFIDYAGTSVGTITLRKRAVWPLSIAQLPASINQVAVVPNPAQNQMNVIIDAKQGETATIQLIDILGNRVLNTTTNIKTGINAVTLPVNHLNNGTYILSINGKTWQINEKIMIAK